MAPGCSSTPTPTRRRFRNAFIARRFRDLGPLDWEPTRPDSGSRHRLTSQTRGLVHPRIGISRGFIMVLDLAVIPANDELEARNDEQDADAAVTGGRISIRGRVPEQALAGRVGPVEPPVEAVKAGPH